MCSSDLTDKRKYSRDPDDLFFPTKSIGSTKTFSLIRDSFRDFRTHFFLQPDDCEFNLDFRKINEDHRTFHLLTTKYISSSDKRIKYFAVIDFLIQLMTAIDSGIIKRPVCLKIEEILSLLPPKTENRVPYEEELSKVFLDLLSRIRTKAYVIATTQYYGKTDDNFKALCNHLFLHKLSREDEKNLRKNYGIPEDDIRFISKLNIGEFVWWDNLKNDEEDTSKIKTILPSHAVAEQGDRFYNLFNYYYPDFNNDNYKIYNDMLKQRSEQENVQKERLKKLEKRDKEKKVKQMKAKLSDTSKLKNELHEMKKQRKTQEKMQLGEKAHSLKVSGLSWNKIGVELGKDPKTVKTYGLFYAKSINDMDFIEKES